VSIISFRKLVSGCVVDMAQNYLRFRGRLVRAAKKLIGALSDARYVKVSVKWSKHERLGRCSVDFQRRSVVFTFKVPLEGMTTEDLAVSCIEALGNPARTAYLAIAAVGFLLAAAVWYFLPPTVPDPTKAIISTVIMAVAIGAIIAGGVGVFLHERRLKDIKREYIALTRTDNLSLKTYSMMVDIISWVLRECSGKNKTVINASEIMTLIQKNYGHTLKILSEKT